MLPADDSDATNLELKKYRYHTTVAGISSVD
jgi:hypothetical protein